MPPRGSGGSATKELPKVDIDDDGLPDLPDADFAAVEEEMETKAKAGKGRRGKASQTKLEEAPISDMPDLDGPDLDPDMRDPLPGSSGDLGSLQVSISEVAQRLSDTANSLTNRMESLQGVVKQVLDLIQVRFDEVQSEVKALKDSMHPILKDALGKANGKTETLVDLAHEKPAGKSEEKTVGRLAKACGQSTETAKKILDACHRFKNAIPFGKVVEWMVKNAGLNQDQALKFLAYLGLTADDYDALDASDFPKL